MIQEYIDLALERREPELKGEYLRGRSVREDFFMKKGGVELTFWGVREDFYGGEKGWSQSHRSVSRVSFTPSECFFSSS